MWAVEREIRLLYQTCYSHIPHTFVWRRYSTKKGMWSC